MPPEQFHWDRRDFRKYDKSGSGQRFTSGGEFGGSGQHRWREQHHPYVPPHPPPYHYHHNHPQQQRLYSDFRSSRPIPPGHGKQGGWRTYPDELGHGFPPFVSRYNDRIIEDANFRPFVSRADGRYFKNSRESRGSYGQKNFRSPSWEPYVASCGSPRRPNAEVKKQKSVENTPTCHNNSSKGNDSPRPLPDPILDQSQDVVKEKSEKDGVTVDEPASSDQKSDKENGSGATDWKLNWNRSESMSSRGSDFSLSSSSRSMCVNEVQQKHKMPVNSSSAAAVCGELTAPAPSDDSISRKKPRLGWGEGLAKFENKIVEGPEDSESKSVLVNGVSTSELMQMPSVNPLDSSPEVADVLLDCASPSTPSSVACSSSRGVEEKESTEALNIDHDPPILSCSPCIKTPTRCEEPNLNSKNLDLASIASLSSLINEILQSDPSYAETSYVRTTSMNKLLVWKVNILKTLEVTESEIDLLETELKSMIAEPITYPDASRLLPGDCHLNPCEQGTVSITVSPAQSQAVNQGEHGASKGEDIDNSGSATSKLVEARFPFKTSECVKSFVFNQDRRAYDAIVTSNKYSARRVLEELNKLLPSEQRHFDVSDADNIFYLQTDSRIIKKRFLTRKQFLLFKEKVITLKFKVFQHFWRQGRIVSVSKIRGKSHKKVDLCRKGYKTNRSSSRSRSSYSVLSSRKVPAEELIEFINRLLAESSIRPCRSTLKMPALILDKQIKMSRFISNNAVVEDPYAVEKERSMINPWTSEETETFIDKLAVFRKDFSKIATFLDHKTIADCVEFYYKNHKSERFQRAKSGVSKRAKSQSATYLVANGTRWNPEANAAYVASDVDNDVIESQKIVQNNTKISLDDNEAVAADVLAGICGSISSEAMTSCITSSVDPTDERKRQRVSSCLKRPLTPENADDECSDESSAEMMNPTNWTDEEKSFFVQAVSSYGKDFAMISECLRTRSVEQCKIFFSKTRKCLGLDGVTPCTVQTGPVFGDDDLECKMEIDVPNHESYIPGASDPNPDSKIYERVMDFHADGKEQCDGANGHGHGSRDADIRTLAEVSDGHYREDDDGEGLILLEDNFENKKVKSPALFPVPDMYQKNSSTDAVINVSSDAITVEHSQKVSRTLPDSIEPCQILRGYPISVQSAKEMNGDFNCVKHVGLTNVPKRVGRSNSDRELCFSLRKCTAGPRNQTENVSDMDKPSPRNGEVKLFGKILISSQEKGVSRDHRDDDVEKVNLDYCKSKVDCNNYLASENNNNNNNNNNILFKSLRFRDESRTALAPIFPVSFSNHSTHTPTSKLDQTLLNSMPFNDVAEYRELQPFTVDMKPPQDVLFSGRNGFSLVQGMPHQPMVGIGVGGRGVVVGGHCSGVSDPVTAIKLHYAKVQSLKAGNMIRQDDTWRSNGDVGR